MTAGPDTTDWTELRHDAGGTPRLLVHGDLDVGTARRFREAVSATLGEPVVVVDLTACTFIDAIGVGALVGAVRRQHVDGGRLVLVATPASPVAKLLVSTGIDRLTPVGTNHPRRELAAAS
jgi:anti-anti-sigma factor